MSNVNYYKILNLDESANNDDIKQSFRRLSFKHHPDMNNGDDTIFKQISEAYTILSDKEKRYNYDLERKMPNPMDLFSMIFNDANMTNINMNRSSGSGLHNMFTSFNQSDIFGFPPFNMFNNMIPTVKHSITVNLTDVYNESTIKTTIEKFIIVDNNKTGTEEEIMVKIPKNICDNNKITIKNKGNSINGVNGDVIIKIIIKSNDKYKLIKNNIHYNHTISLKDALCGFSFRLKYLDDKTYQINNNSHIIYPNYKKRIDNLGLPSKDGHGSLYIIFSIDFPKTISSENKKLLDQIL